MIGSWWEFKGVKTKLPKDLVLRKSGGFDKRYKIVKDFLADKRWVFKDPIGDYYAKQMVDSMLKPSILL